MWELGLGIMFIALIIILYTLVERHSIISRSKEEVENELYKDRERLDALSRLMDMTHLDENDLIKYSLDEAVRLTDSTIGYLHFIDAEVNIEMFCWSNEVYKQCTVGKIDKYPIEEAGIWSDCVRRREPVIHNDYSIISFSDKLPKGHVPIHRHMSVPIYDGETIVAVVGLGNKASPYTMDDARQLILFMTNMWSILRNKRHETEIKKERDKAQKYLDMVEVIVLALDSNAHVTMVNRKCCDVLGYSDDELLNRNWMECCIPKEERAQVHSVFTSLMESEGDIGSFEYVEGLVVRRNGEKRIIKWHNSVLYDEDGSTLIGTLSSGEDVTDLREFENKQHDMLVRAAQTQKLESIGTLAGGIAHDFNNILSPMLGYAELLQLDLMSLGEGGDRLSYVDSIISAGNRAKELVNQILTFSKKNNDDYKSVVDLVPIIRESVRLLRATVPSSININIDIDMDTAPVLCSPVKIQQIIMNLGVNAFQAMDREHGEIYFNVSNKVLSEDDINGVIGMTSGYYVCITVSDNGVGIAEEHISNIFDPFFTTKSDKDGSGLGLSIVHGIVTSYKGEIRVYSEFGVGTTFNVYFPIVEGAMDQFSETLQADIVGGCEKVLLIDDESAVGDVMVRMLCGLGYEVDMFGSSNEALEHFKKSFQEYNLVITDQSMPDLTGLELAQEFLSIDPNMRVLLCTGYNNKNIEEKAYNIGVAGVLNKPFTLRELAISIREVL